MGWQIALTGALVFSTILAIDLGINGVHRSWKAVGGIAFLLVPIGLFIQIWQ